MWVSLVGWLMTMLMLDRCRTWTVYIRLGGTLSYLNSIAPSLWNILHPGILTTAAASPTAMTRIIECVRHDTRELYSRVSWSNIFRLMHIPQLTRVQRAA
ncbi:hypothetical protein DFJ58DRAFT_786232 [Suillus subalutaceus]|uniref:uncharacterized protein n=1 Tax=Suillus subalutaceus TaxID=48586 RepID=UPI001B85C560|nr:uncharacterized protein DFJ58DRAFT_786232 [Suillus subalutaceus]KAG1855344.1 hypothetical protein DFJ58DRAFT_786232 [Suillus subalutaceus]